ncbi:uncharacterized protein TRIADDRAFT_51917 [Trichoplax adhaerens]|uniref:MAM domain-containing protein n=1 Tax=Trichoplax adhaerens TaxID=10228 RepID=B3RL85_TRIAD|nr:predicted protein [Trichoplax adhaerens]EDV29501.1 predicted protein [Trichoplax adhaerens]|eukprot:XP_002108703.1 predicted protein [Trichoplax adhaerens]
MQCLSGCQCLDKNVAICSSLPENFDKEHRNIKKIILIRPNCNCQFARWYRWIEWKEIDVEGACYQPSQFLNIPVQSIHLEALICPQDSPERYCFHVKLSPNITDSTTYPVDAIGCDFQKGLCGFRQIRNADSIDWDLKSGPTTYSMVTGPLSDHTYGTATGKYLYMNSLPNPQNSVAEIISPPLIIADQVKTVNIIFYYQLYGRDIGGIRLYAIYSKYSLTKYQIWERKYNRGPYWRKADIMFNPQYPEYQIIFQAIDGGTYSDIAIDDIYISPFEEDCYSGSNYGIYYRGTTSTTQAGIICQSWFTVFPHQSNFSSTFENQLEVNYCRNPGGSKSKPWCYTINASIQWQYCDLSQCPPRLPIKPTSLPGDSKFASTLPISIGPNGLLAFFRGSVWGTICISSDWGYTVSTVICKQKGISISGITKAIKLNKAYEGDPSWYYPIECTGLEDSLEQCKSNVSDAKGLVSCDDNYAIGVDCLQPTTGWPTHDPIEYYSVLAGGKSLREGYLQVYSGSSNSFTTVCSTLNNSLPLDIPDVMCREQGFLYALSTEAELIELVIWPRKSWIYDLHCTGYEHKIYRCQQMKYDNVDLGPKCERRNKLITAKCKADESDLNTLDPSCDFEKGFCGWNYKHRIPFTNLAYWVYKDDSEGHYLPIPDLAGNFIYTIQGPFWTSGSSAALASPLLQIANDANLVASISFKYYVYGRNFQKIEVLIKNGSQEGASTKTLWSQELTVQQISGWIPQTLPLQSSTDFSILIVAYSKYIDYNPNPTPPLSAIALDDIKFTNIIKKNDRTDPIPIILVTLGLLTIIVALFVIVGYVSKKETKRSVVVTNDK